MAAGRHRLVAVVLLARWRSLRPWVEATTFTTTCYTQPDKLTDCSCEKHSHECATMYCTTCHHAFECDTTCGICGESTNTTTNPTVTILSNARAWVSLRSDDDFESDEDEEDLREGTVFVTQFNDEIGGRRRRYSRRRRAPSGVVGLLGFEVVVFILVVVIVICVLIQLIKACEASRVEQQRREEWQRFEEMKRREIKERRKSLESEQEMQRQARRTDDDPGGQPAALEAPERLQMEQPGFPAAQPGFPAAPWQMGQQPAFPAAQPGFPAVPQPIDPYAQQPGFKPYTPQPM